MRSESFLLILVSFLALIDLEAGRDRKKEGCPDGWEKERLVFIGLILSVF